MNNVVRMTLAALLLGTSYAHAVGNHPVGGCGLGYVIFSSKYDEPLYQILGAIGNSISGNQTFGISSGTSGCTEDGVIASSKELNAYAEANVMSLRAEMAAGQGEFVSTFAAMLSDSPTAQTTLVTWFQSNYTRLFPSDRTTSAQMLQNLQQAFQEKPELVS